MTDYIPIDCGRYSELELAIMHRTRLRLCWHAAAGIIHMEILTPTDLRTRRGEEYLFARSAAGSEHAIRLDHIISSEPEAQSDR